MPYSSVISEILKMGHWIRVRAQWSTEYKLSNKAYRSRTSATRSSPRFTWILHREGTAGEHPTCFKVLPSQESPKVVIIKLAEREEEREESKVPHQVLSVAVKKCLAGKSHTCIVNFRNSTRQQKPLWVHWIRDEALPLNEHAPWSWSRFGDHVPLLVCCYPWQDPGI